MTRIWQPSQLEQVGCELCGCPAENPWLIRKDGLSVVKCACGFAFLSPRPKADEVARLYSGDYYESSAGVGYSQYRGEGIRAFVSGVARKNILYLRNQGWDPSGSRLLEVGSALGDFCFEADRAGARVIGLDLSEEGITEARTIHPGLTFRVGTVASVLKEEGLGSFDTVCAYEVIEHCLSVHEFLQHVADLLRPGGFFALSTPNLARAFGLEDPSTWLGFTSSFEHLTFLSPETLRSFAEITGFMVVSMHSVESHQVAKPRKSGIRVRDVLHPFGDWDTARWMKDFNPDCLGHQLNAVLRKR